MAVSQVLGEKGTGTSVGDVFSSILRALKQAIVHGVGAIADKLLTVAAKVLRGMVELLDRPLRIPLLSTLYEKVINPGQPLSLLGAMTLAIAAPLTLGYKAFTMVTKRKVITPVVATKNQIKYPKAQVSLDMIGDIMNRMHRTIRRANGEAVEDDIGDLLDPGLVASWVFGGAYTTAQIYMALIDIGKFQLTVGMPVNKLSKKLAIRSPVLKYPLDTSTFYDPLYILQLNLEFTKQVGVFVSLVGSFPVALFLDDASNTDIGLEIGAWAVGAAIYTLDLCSMCDNLSDPLYPGCSVSRGTTIQSLLGAVHAVFIGLLAKRQYKAIKDSDDDDNDKDMAMVAWGLKTAANGMTVLGETAVPLPEMAIGVYTRKPSTETLKLAMGTFVLHDTVAQGAPGVVLAASQIVEAIRTKPFRVF
eukprot:TRINITY_DN11490_c0_g1_i1.p1 TRINITY_DN11490_c0_g1~~TRINITY_DN11490_c0_g1_i1.p1  ORF type:complete len:487 (+),score=156.77 TRINITY_DN11490_c0_g1_i1:213-1463(+)